MMRNSDGSPCSLVFRSSPVLVGEVVVLDLSVVHCTSQNLTVSTLRTRGGRSHREPAAAQTENADASAALRRLMLAFASIVRGWIRSLSQLSPELLL